MSHTGAARAGIINLTKSLSVEWAQNGVRVNSVAPGIIWSATAGENYKNASGGEILLSSQWLRCPAKRIGTVEEVSAAVCFLLSPASAFTTGETIKVDGASSLKNEMYIADHNNLPAYGRTPPPKPQRDEIVKAFRSVRDDAFWPGPASYNDTRRKKPKQPSSKLWGSLWSEGGLIGEEARGDTKVFNKIYVDQ